MDMYNEKMDGKREIRSGQRRRDEIWAYVQKTRYILKVCLALKRESNVLSLHSPEKLWYLRFWHVMPLESIR